MFHDIVHIKMLESPIVRTMKGYDNRHHFAQRQTRVSAPLDLAGLKELFLPQRFKLGVEIIDITKDLV